MSSSRSNRSSAPEPTSEDVISVANRYNAVIDRMQQEAKAYAYPPPDSIGKRPSVAQIALLHRIKAAPVRVSWGGLLWEDPAMVYGLPYTPPLIHSTTAGLWRKGLLRRRRQDTICVSKAGERFLDPDLLAGEHLRWAALVVLSEELVADWQKWRERGCPFDERPVKQATQKMIIDKMEVIQGANASLRLMFTDRDVFSSAHVG